MVPLTPVTGGHDSKKYLFTSTDNGQVTHYINLGQIHNLAVPQRNNVYRLPISVFDTINNKIIKLDDYTIPLSNTGQATPLTDILSGSADPLAEWIAKALNE